MANTPFSKSCSCQLQSSFFKVSAKISSDLYDKQVVASQTLSFVHFVDLKSTFSIFQTKGPHFEWKYLHQHFVSLNIYFHMYVFECRVFCCQETFS